MKKWAWILAIILLLGAAWFGIWDARQQSGLPRTEAEIIQELVQGYVLVPTANEKLLAELGRVNQDSADKWREIMECWAESDNAMPVNMGVLPDGLEDSNQLCIIVLGFQLNPDGSMQQELIGRLECARKSAEKYPKSYILCTGGGDGCFCRNHRSGCDGILVRRKRHCKGAASHRKPLPDHRGKCSLL